VAVFLYLSIRLESQHKALIKIVNSEFHIVIKASYNFCIL
jgi:hypothetical protein